MVVLEILQEDMDDKQMTEADQRKFTYVFMVTIVSDSLSESASIRTACPPRVKSSYYKVIIS